ncbi:MAG: D-cysteine desulfhydrase family protein [Bdellovibrionota bacterium]
MFGNYPTPLLPLRRLSKALNGPEIWIKRDDLTGLAFGGNKTRKLEHLISDALAKDANVVITAGAQQSNHCRQTAAACAAAGIECHLVLGGSAPRVSTGNFLLDQILGASIHLSGPERKGESIARIADELGGQGKRPYVVPYGGSNAIGARGFVDAIAELREQMHTVDCHFDRIVFPSSSGGTQAGMLVGARVHSLATRVTGVAIDKNEAGERPFDEHIAEIANELRAVYSFEGHFSRGDVELLNDYVGAGYGVVGKLEREAISLVAETEGILLDPVYTGRAMGALIDQVRRGEVGRGERVLFWHTGGSPAIFAYAAELSQGVGSE